MPEPNRNEPSRGSPFSRPVPAALLVAALAFAAYLPALRAEFVYDDGRFIEENEAIHHLSPGLVAACFTNPKIVDETGWKGIYRPLRTLEFAVDWAISGGRPWFFHLRSMVWHALGAVLVLLVFRRLAGAAPDVVPAGALCGALVYALHPVAVECVAFVSSRGDLLCAVLFLGALLCHMRGSRWAAALMVAAAVFAKEVAVVFAGAALLVDLYRRAKPAWAWYFVYGGIGVAFTALWFQLVAGGNAAEMSQTALWWGGSYPMHLATMAKGYLEYARLLVFPVDLTAGWHVPARSALDAGTVVSIGLVAAIVAIALLYSRRSRFGLLWFALLLFPASNVVVRLAIPTAERFLLLPAVGFCFAVGPLLARTRLRYVVLACFFAITFQRTLDWRTEDTLWESALSVAENPTALSWRAERELERAERTKDPADAEKVLATVDAFFRIYFDDIQFAPKGVPGAILVDREAGGPMLLRKAKALLILGRNEEARKAALGAATFGGLKEGRRLAEIAERRMR